MKFVKAFGLAVAAAVAAMAFVGASAATAATIHAESCMVKTPTECKTASIGTTFVAKTIAGAKAKLSNGFITNECDSTVEGKITGNASTGSANTLTAEITNATFTPCSFTEVKVLKLPWTLETNETLFLKSSTGLILGAEVDFPKIGCKFSEDATHTVVATWTNANMSSLKLSGSMKRTEGIEFLCGNEGAISGSYEITSVNDPALAESLNIKIL
jgi:hypothetical protein